LYITKRLIVKPKQAGCAIFGGVFSSYIQDNRYGLALPRKKAGNCIAIAAVFWYNPDDKLKLYKRRMIIWKTQEKSGMLLPVSA
jgi:hypothetical protein